MFPSATTTFFGQTLINAGAVTTTYTAPATCTPGQRHQVAGLLNGKPDVLLPLTKTCNGHPYLNTALCLPSENEFFSAHTNVNLQTAYLYTYYSPAGACPSGWVTKGIASAASDGSVKSSGEAFSWGSQTTPYFTLPFPNFWVYNLEPQETVLFCCPT